MKHRNSPYSLMLHASYEEEIEGLLLSLDISVFVHMCAFVVDKNRDEKVSVWLHSRFRKSNG